MQHPVLLHIREHTWLWVAGLTALGVLAAVLDLSTPAALLFMVVGLLVILKSQGTDLLTIVTSDPLATADEAPRPEANSAAAWGNVTPEAVSGNAAMRR
jgi:hypothetical protein